MTMHLVGPYLSTTGKHRGKKKFRNAEEARRSRELDQSWQQLKSKWGATSTKSKPASITLPTAAAPYIRDTGPKPSSLSSWCAGPVASKQAQQYTGGNILGIGTLHKSNAVPIFNNQEAEDIAKMRR